MGALADKVAIITGASSGIGYATAKLFAAEGAKLVVTARRRAELDRLVAEIESVGGSAVAVAGDVRDETLAEAVVQTAIERFGGVVNNFIGDGLFASFNLPLPQEKHAAAAIQAALEIQRELAGKTFAAGVRLRTRIGINTGPVVGVTIGTDNRLNYTLLGDAVNIAARVEQLNKQFGTLVMATESTVRAAGDGFPCTRLGETGVRGHRGDVVVYRIDPA